MLTRRLQVLVEPDQYLRLQRYAKTRGVSVGEAVREAIDRVAGPSVPQRQAALTRLLAAEPIAFPDDPAELEREIDAMLDAAG